MAQSHYLKIIILTIIFGLGAGIVGQLFVDAYLFPPENFVSQTGSKIQNKISRTEENQRLTDAYNSVAPTVMEIYSQKQNSSVGANQVYLSKDRIALAVSLTSDGWLATSGLSADPKNRFVVAQNNKIFIPEQVVSDESTNIAFIKIDAKNLPIPKLGTSEKLFLGQTAVIPVEKQSFVLTSIESLFYTKNSEPRDLFHSTEKPSKFILASNRLAANDAGAPLVNYDGEVVGLISEQQGLVVPTEAWHSAFLSLLKNGKISRPLLGLQYLDLSETLGLAEEVSGGRVAGALIWSDATLKILGVAKNGPAAKAGLRDGDIILKINAEEVTARTGLAEIIQDYSPGDEINITFVRDGKEELIKIKLE